jgi:hypothetical protein
MYGVDIDSLRRIIPPSEDYGPITGMLVLLRNAVWLLDPVRSLKPPH